MFLFVHPYQFFLPPKPRIRYVVFPPQFPSSVSGHRSSVFGLRSLVSRLPSSIFRLLTSVIGHPSSNNLFVRPVPAIHPRASGGTKRAFVLAIQPLLRPSTVNKLCYSRNFSLREGPPTPVSRLPTPVFRLPTFYPPKL